MRAAVALPGLFLGVTPAPVRRYLTSIMEPAAKKYSRLVLPCAGRFSGTMVALKCGFKPEQVFTSDISLFTGMIGLLAAGKDVRELGAVVELPSLPDLEALANEASDPLDHAAAVLVAMKIAVTQGDGAYTKMFITDLRGEWRRHFDMVKKGLTTLVGDLKGINYEPADLFDAVKANADDPNTIIYLAPPDVSGGYEKMFDTGTIVRFKQPPIANFDPKGGFTRLEEFTKDAKALILTLKPHDDRKMERHPDAVFALLNGSRLSLLLANRKDEAKAMTRMRINVPTEKTVNPKYPVWGSAKDVITADSKLYVTKAKKEVALYYRDLFAHRLGASNAETFFLMWLDGKLFGTIGMSLQFAIGGRPYDAADGRLFVWQMFGMSPSHPKYKHVNRLVTMCITCTEFLDVLKAGTRFPMGDPVGVRTVCFTKGPEHKGNRGLMKLLSREKRDDGMYHLVYATEWRPGRFSDQVGEWVKRYANSKESTNEEAAGADTSAET